MYTHKCIGTNNSGYFEVHYSSPRINYVPQVKHKILSQGLRQPEAGGIWLLCNGLLLGARSTELELMGTALT